MENLVKFIMAGATLFSLVTSQPQESPEKYNTLTRKLCELNDDLKEILIHSYKSIGHFIKEKDVKFYPCYNDSTRFDSEEMKIKLTQTTFPEDYVSMIDPKSEEVLSIVQKIDTKNKTNLQIAEEVFNTLKNYKFEGIKYKYDPGQHPVEQMFLKQTSPLAYSALKDPVNHPEQTLKDKNGDCEDLSILYSSCLLAKGTPCAPISVKGHVFSLLKSGDEEFNPVAIDRFVLDWQHHGWVPIDITDIGKAGFDRALEKGMQSFFINSPYFNILIPEQYKELFGY